MQTNISSVNDFKYWIENYITGQVKVVNADGEVIATQDVPLGGDPESNSLLIWMMAKMDCSRFSGLGMG